MDNKAIFISLGIFLNTLAFGSDDDMNQIQIRENYIKQSLQITSCINDIHTKEECFGAIAWSLSLFSHSNEKAIQLVLQISRDMDRDYNLRQIAKNIAARGYIKEGLKTALMISRLRHRAETLFEVISRIENKDNKNRLRTEIIEYVRSQIEEEKDLEERDRCLEVLAYALERDNELDEAYSLTKLIYANSLKGHIIAPLACCYVRNGQVEKAVEMANKCSQPIRDEALEGIAITVIEQISQSDSQLAAAEIEEEIEMLEFKDLISKLMPH